MRPRRTAEKRSNLNDESHPATSKRKRRPSKSKAESKKPKHSNNKAPGTTQDAPQHSPGQETSNDSTAPEITLDGDIGLLLAIDPGSEDGKGGWAEVAVVDGELQAPSISELKEVEWKEVTWLNKGRGIASQMVHKVVPCQMAYKAVPGQSEPVLIFGYEVDDALKKGDIKYDDVMRRVKPMLLRGLMAQQKKSEAELARLSNHMQFLNLDTGTGGADVRKDNIKDGGTHARDNEPTPYAEAHYAKMLQLLIHQSLRHMSEKSPHLKLPKFKNIKDTIKFLQSAKNIRIAIAVPDECSPAQKDRIAKAAITAGVHGTIYLVSEAAAALADSLARDVQNGTPVEDQGHMLVDWGGASADIHAIFCYTAAAVEQLWVSTNWIGGTEVNRAARDFIIDSLSEQELEHILKQIKENRNLAALLQKSRPEGSAKARISPPLKEYTRKTLEDEIVRDFEIWKKQPSDDDERFVHISGLPDVPGSALCERNRFRLTREDTRIILNKTLRLLTNKMIQGLQKMADDNAKKGKTGNPVSCIRVCGGTSANRYSQRRIRAAVKEWTDGHGGR